MPVSDVYKRQVQPEEAVTAEAETVSETAETVTEETEE